MKLGISLLFAFLLLVETPVFSYGNQLTDGQTLQQKSENAEKRKRRRDVLLRRAKNPWFRMLNAIERSVGRKFPLYFGLTLTAAGVIFFLLREKRREREFRQSRAIRSKVSILFLSILAIGSILRLYNLDEKSLDHTEIFVPGIPLPKDLSAPPPRITLAETISWHFHVEPHPPGYYFLMWPWTKLFGTSEFVIRLPSVLFGIASIWIIYQLVSLTHTRRAALIAAAMLALNGHHIFWSQMARMYSMMCFLGLLSTLLLYRIAVTPARRISMEAAYAGVTLVGLFTEILFWPFLAAQALWAGIALQNEANQADRVLRLQAILIMLGTPLWAHAVYRARVSHLAEPTLSFLQHFFTFGFLIHPDLFALQQQHVSLLIAIPLLLISFTLILFAYRKRSNPIPQQPNKDPGVWVTLPIALGAIATAIGFSLMAHIKRQDIAKTIFVPIVALFVPWILAMTGRMVRWIGSRLRFDAFLESPDLFYYLLAFLPSVGVFLLSYWFPLLGTRLFLLFVPFLLILISISLAQLQPKRIVFPATAVILLAAHLFSVIHFYRAFSTPINYKGLAQEINQRFQDGDLIFVRPKHWGVTPLFYYLPDRRESLISKDFDQAIEQRQPGKVFVIHFKGLPPTPQMESAVKGLLLQEVVERRRAYADIYIR